MAENRLDGNDPRVTAYVLDELSGDERSSFEAELRGSSALQAAVADLRETTAHVFAALQAGPVDSLSPAARERIRAAARQGDTTGPRPASTLAATLRTGARRSSYGVVVLASLAMVGVAAVIGLAVPTQSTPELVKFAGTSGETLLAFTQPWGARPLDGLGTVVTLSDGSVVDGEALLLGIREAEAGGRPYSVELRHDLNLHAEPPVAEEGWRYRLEAAQGSGAKDAYFRREMQLESAPLPGLQQATPDASDGVKARMGGLGKKSGQAAAAEDQTLPNWLVTGNSFTPGNSLGGGGGGGGLPSPQRRLAQPGGEGAGQAPGQGQPAMHGAGAVGPGTGLQGGGWQRGRERADGVEGRGGIRLPQPTRHIQYNEIRDQAERGAGKPGEPHVLGEAEQGNGRDGEPSRSLDTLYQAGRGENAADVRLSKGRLDEYLLYRGKVDAGITTLAAPVQGVPLPALTSPAMPEDVKAVRESAEQSGAHHFYYEAREKYYDAREKGLDFGFRHQSSTDGDVNGNGVIDPGERDGAVRERMEQVDALARYGRMTEEQKLRLLQLTPDYSRPDFDALYEVLPGQVPGTEAYAPIVENGFVSPLDQPLSTFSIDVDTAAYANVRRFLEQDQWPPADAVRVEELVNYFGYTYAEPEGAHPFAVTLEAAACPWQPEHRLVRVGLKGQELQQAERPATTLVFLIDVSGSMRADNKLPLVKQSLRLLVEQLTENDRIAIVTYSNEAALRLDGTSGDRRDEILALIESLNADGSTNGAAGIQMAYDAAQRHFLERGTNRVILLTDGDFNVGVSDDEELVKMIEEKRKSGVFLSIFGFGMGNLKDAKLEKLADKGNGHYGYIDGLDEAKKVFVQDLTGTLYTIAKDVKLQVDFNPVEVGAYRLIGYENRALAAADFNNDAVDAGDIGAGHRVTALYEIVPASKLAPVEEAQPAQGVEPSKYVMRSNRRFRTSVASDPATAGAGSQKSEVGGQQSDDRNTAGKTSELSRSTINDQPSTSAELLTVRLRYKRPNSEESTRWDVPLVDKGQQAAPSQDFAWSAAVASFGLLLRQSKYRGQASFDAVLETAQAAKGDDPAGHRREFIDLVLRAKSLWDRAHGVESPRAEQLTSLESRDRASVNGKYRELLDKLEASEDLAIYGPYHDYGRWEGTAYRGREGLPPGYWVYVHPHWYIWGELATP